MNPSTPTKRTGLLGVALVACTTLDPLILAEHHTRDGSAGQASSHGGSASAGHPGAGTAGAPGGAAGAPPSTSTDHDPCGPVDTPAVVIADHQDGPGYLATDGEFLYWAQSNIPSQTVWRAPKDGSGLPALLASNVSPYGIAVDETYVFWVTYADGGTYDGGGSLYRAPKAGGSSEVISSHHPRPTDLVRDGAELFWIASGTLKNDYTDGRVLRWSEGMQEAQVLVEDHEQVEHLAVAGDSVFWVDNTAALSGSAVPSVIYRVDRQGGPPEKLATSTSFVSLTADQEATYWSNHEGIWRMPHGSGTSELLLNQSLGVSQMQVWGECLYLNSYSGVMRLSKHGGKLAPIASSNQFAHLRVDASGLYGSRYSEGSVVHLALP